MGNFTGSAAEQRTGIEWTNRTWNPTTGCDKISAGCKHCYAEPLAERLHRMKNPRYPNGFQLTLHPDKLDEPVGWKTPEWVFVNSMSDLLHQGVPDAFLLDAFHTMGRIAAWHRYQVLTKRADRWGDISARVIDHFGSFPRNVLPGASVENKRHGLPRIAQLALAGDDDTCRMLSVEPLLESLCDGDVAGLAQRFTEARIGWVITGGESGWHARPCVDDWFREVRDACEISGIPFFHKQFGGMGVTHEAKRGGTLATLDGQLHHAMPEVWHAEPPGRRQASLLAAR
jgi:protein gp37